MSVSRFDSHHVMGLLQGFKDRYHYRPKGSEYAQKIQTYFEALYISFSNFWSKGEMRGRA